MALDPYLLGIAASLVVLLFVFYLLRRGVLREKFAVLWLVVAVALVVMAAFPETVVTAAHFLGVQVPANLLFFLTAVVLLLVSVQLSYEVSRLEAKTRRLAEEIALLRYAIEDLARGRDDAPDCDGRDERRSGS